MRKGLFALAAAGLLAGSMAACSDKSDDSSAGGGSGEAAKAGKVGVILPDTKSSARWETADYKYLTEAFKAAGVEAEIKNAQGDKASFQTIADGMIQSGVKVLMIVNLDSGTGKNVLENAKKAGIATIDYDRLTLSGGADYYVSFDNVEVGKLQGQGLVDCLTAAKASKPVVSYLNGSPTDNNATLSRRATTRSWRPSSSPVSTSRARTTPFRSGTTPRAARSSSSSSPRTTRSPACWRPTTASATRPSRC